MENPALPHDDGDSDPTDWVRVGDRLHFFASDGESTGLWETDGTETGTRRLDRIPGTRPEHRPAPRFVLPIGDLLYFVPGQGDHRNELMVADLVHGELRSLVAGGEGRGEMVGVALDGRLLFATRNQLVLTDGNPSGTLSLGAVQLQRLVALDDGTALGLGWRVEEDGELRNGLWHVDGTPSGIRLVRELPYEPWHVFESLVSTGSSAWFTAPDPEGAATDEVLWFSDGTAAGTRPVLSLPEPVARVLWWPGPEPVASGGRVFVVARSQELWVGEESGEVRRIATLASGFDPDQFIGRDSGIRSLTPFCGGILFAANDGWYGKELMWSDGTSQGTRRVADLQPGSTGSSPRHFVVDGDRAFFVAFRWPSAWVWITDGTAEGTAPLFEEVPDRFVFQGLELAPLGDRLLFAAEEPRVGLEPWVFPLPGEIVPPLPPTVPGPPEDLRTGQRIPDSGPVLEWRHPQSGSSDSPLEHPDLLYFAIEARRFDEEGFRLLRREPGYRTFAGRAA